MLPEGVGSRLVVDGRCSLVSPMEKLLDKYIEALRGGAPIGTTGRGIGPTYAMHALRLSPRLVDVMDGFDFTPLLRFYAKLGIEDAGLEGWAEKTRETMKGLVGDVGGEVDKVRDSGGRVLFEASQGTLLDSVHGTYPYVTSTHTVSTSIASSVGVGPDAAGDALGVTKCYTTRVGGGPFPTEVAGPLGDKIREIGKEYGATTGRPRRVGWLDIVALKYAVRLNGVKRVALTKVDVLSKVGEFKVCVAYRIDGSETTDFLAAVRGLRRAEPVYASPADLRGAEYGPELPRAGKNLVRYIEQELGVEVGFVSYGEERSQTIEL
jgi:adenylosuccinate synthase